MEEVELEVVKVQQVVMVVLVLSYSDFLVITQPLSLVESHLLQQQLEMIQL